MGDALDTVRSIRSDLGHDSDHLGVRGGTSFVVRGAIDTAVADLAELGRLTSAVVDELHRRAALCDQYTAAIRQYEHDHRRWVDAVQRYRATADTDHPVRWPGAEPVPPGVPFPGAVRG